MKYCVTGAAGFIGSHVVDRLLDRNCEVIGVDNYSTGIGAYLANARNRDKFTEVEVDITDLSQIADVIAEVDCVYHLAANADIRGGTANTFIDIQQNTIGTYNVLEAMRKSPTAKRICFASSAAALGEPQEFPTPEDLPVPRQTSLYGASKMAGEGLVSAFCNAFGLEGYSFRFVSLLGPRYPHGHVFDFVKKLRSDNKVLEVLGDGTAKKSYLHIKDCVDALMLVCEEIRPAASLPGKYDVFNLGVDHYIQVRQSAELIAKTLNLTPKLSFGDGARGWVGDNPFVLLDTSKIRQIGWRPKHGIEESIIETTEWLMRNDWIFEERV